MDVILGADGELARQRGDGRNRGRSILFVPHGLADGRVGVERRGGRRRDGPGSQVTRGRAQRDGHPRRQGDRVVEPDGADCLGDADLERDDYRGVAVAARPT